MKELLKPDDYEPYQEYGREHYEPLLDYVSQLIEKLFPYSKMDWEYGYYCCSKRYSYFVGRYFKNELNKTFEQRFIDNKEVQETIKGLGLDVEKFWYLLLFIYDYSYGECVERLVFDESPRNQLEKFRNAILLNIKEVGAGLSNIEYNNQITITLKIEGKKKVVIDIPVAITMLCCLLVQNDNKFKDSDFLNKAVIINKWINGDFEIIPEINSVQIWFFAKTFQTFFKLNPHIKGRSTKGTTLSLNKLLLISKLIYITGLSKNENFLGSDETLKGYLQQYKDYKVNGMNKFYM